MKLIIFLGFVVSASGLQERNDDVDNNHTRLVSYQGFKVIRLTPKNQEHVSLLTTLIRDHAFERSGIEAWDRASLPGRTVDLLVSPSKIADILSFASTHGMDMSQQNLIHDLHSVRKRSNDNTDEQELNSTRTGNQSDELLTMIDPNEFFSKFRTLSEINNFLLYLKMKFPNLVTVESIGQSFEGRDINLIRITSELNEIQQLRKQIFLMDAGFHAREWLSPSTALFFAYTLVSQYDSSNDIQNVLNKWDFRIIPVVNPDGYEYTHTTNRLWRKTRSVNGKSSCRGVDPNRNFDFKWGNNDGILPEDREDSSDPCSLNYAGSNPLSEPETSSIANYMTQYQGNITVYTTVHCGSNSYWLTPWAYTRRIPSDYEELKFKAKIAAAAIALVNNETEYKVGNAASLLYPAPGVSSDYAKGVVGIPFSYALELKCIVDQTRFIVPPTMIVPTGRETTAGLIALAQSFEGE